MTIPVSAEMDRNAEDFQADKRRMYATPPASQVLLTPDNDYIGSLGAQAFRLFLDQQNIRYIEDKTVRTYGDRYDFIVYGVGTVDVKTMSCRGVPWGFVLVGAHHPGECNIYVFAGWNKTDNIVWLFGWEPRVVYLAKARLLEKGEEYHHWTCKHPAYAREIADLRPISGLLSVVEGVGP